MKIVITMSEILNHGDWSTFCQLRGYDEYILREGLASGDDEEELTPGEVRDFGLALYVKVQLDGAA